MAAASWVAFFDVQAASRAVCILPAHEAHADGEWKPPGRALKLDPSDGRRTRHLGYRSLLLALQLYRTWCIPFLLSSG